MARVNRTDQKSTIQARQKAWLNELLEITKISPSKLADGAGVSDTTITRLLNNPDYTGTLSAETIDRLKEAYKVPGPEEYAYARARAGFAEAERTDLHRNSELQDMGKTLLVGRPPEATTWRLRTAALEGAGFLPGDIVVVDPNARPEPHDAVCAHIYDAKRGSTETIFRVYDPPYLLAASHDRLAYKPLLVDQERVLIVGVVVASLRPHRLSRAR